MPGSLVRRAALALSTWLLATPASAQPAVRPEVVATYPHDPEAFTQGLLLHDGKLYESTGLFGRSSLRLVAITTGVVERSVALPDDWFGEGLALAGQRLIQLTWQNRVAIVWDLSLTRTASFEYAGEGWGLCYDGRRLVMSDGTSRLSFRDPQTFALLGEVEVRDDRGPVTQLNELECAGGLVYANVWQTNAIVRVDPSTGRVLHLVDGSGLLTPNEAATADVMNGIAFDPSSGHFFVTGKLWPKLFELRVVFDDNDNGNAGAGGTGPDGGESPGGGAAGASGRGSKGELAGGAEVARGRAERRQRNGCGCTMGAGRATGTAWFLALAFLARRRNPITS